MGCEFDLAGDHIGSHSLAGSSRSCFWNAQKICIFPIQWSLICSVDGRVPITS